MQDVRLALRGLAARPAFTAVAILTLALGIGANTAVFTVVNGVLLSPLPYRDPARVVILNETTPQFPTLSASWQNYVDWRDRSRSFETVAAFRAMSMTLTGGGDAERLPAKMLTATLLPLLGVQPTAGRGFTDEDDRPGAADVALLSEGLVQRRFGGSDMLGRTITLDNRPYTVVGIMPSRFELFQPADVYVAMGPWAATLPDDRGWHPGILPVARLAPATSIEQARADLETLTRQLESEYPQTNRNVRAKVTVLGDQVVQNVRPALLMLLGAVSLVLLIACANVANLLLARAVRRQKEIAVRTALGAGRGRIVQQLITESVVLACLGGIAGALVASWGVSLLMNAMAAGLPRAGLVGVDWRVLAFTLVVSVATGLLYGLVPALQVTRLDIREALNQETRGGGSGGVRHQRMRSTLVVAEIALALMLLIGAGLLLRSFARLQNVESGFDATALFVVDLPLSPTAYANDTTRVNGVERLVERVRALPGIQGAAMSTGLPMAGGGATLTFNIVGRPPKGPEDYTSAGYRAVTPGYLEVMRIPLRRGRLFTERDRAGAPAVAIINESMARQFFAGIDPIGQRVQTGTEPDPDPASPVMEIVGVVGDVRQSFSADPKAEMFVAYGQQAHPVLGGLYRNVSLVARTTGDPLAISSSIRGAIRELDPDQPLVRIRTMEQSIASTVAQPRLQTTLLTVFAGVAVALALIGVYGVMAYTVSQRTQEIGVRVALGASSADVVRMVVGDAARLAAAGVVLGLIGAAIVSRLLRSQLFDTGGLDPLAFVVAPAVLVAAALCAAWLPARRAARVVPTVALGR